ncbi:hypothetical protein PV773_11845 [Mesorhizobium sp. CC13]|uniref:hypothetical protein n=1 Tax=Mesorhizobium sp. CC13 TaxID=3029194 RepID=UPI0032679964
MRARPAGSDPIEILVAARKIADFASAEGVSAHSHSVRAYYDHLGAVLADAVLQAGLNYASVVRPRVNRILVHYPHAATSDALVEIIRTGCTTDFLDWKHPVKAARFERIVISVCNAGIKDVDGLRVWLRDDDFCDHLQELHGIGPKTVDYMACLIGIESIAVDRHIRTFAKRVGIDVTDYHYLKKAFCFAADLLSVSRREFDAWIWRRESKPQSRQLSLAF